MPVHESGDDKEYQQSPIEAGGISCGTNNGTDDHTENERAVSSHGSSPADHTGSLTRVVLEDDRVLPESCGITNAGKEEHP